ncbi:DUF998 domain-containing protein [Streptomyces sp. NPDC102381]|uniref:DUF998 domain-containing protein n=1 Tax=Streptomyces sp. NPDC102381 TaxID=3366164 RepID=UPI003824BF3E
MRNSMPAVGLFFLAPLIGEMLLGATSLDALALLPVLALLYGSGALLIRELVRRTGRGWGSILLLGAAYALLEEGLLDQMLFNADYSGNYDMVTVTPIPLVGTGAYGLISVLAVHALWSITVPIALMEALVPQRAARPWLGRTGFTVTAGLLVLGAVVVGWGSYDDSGYMAPWPLLAGTAAVVAALVAAAFLIPRPRPGLDSRGAPRPLFVGIASCAATSAFWLVLQPSWMGVAASLAIAVAAGGLVHHWARARDWAPTHVFALAAGATLTYAWVGFGQTPDQGSAGTVNLVGHILLAGAAVALLCLTGRRVGTHYA